MRSGKLWNAVILAILVFGSSWSWSQESGGPTAETITDEELDRRIAEAVDQRLEEILGDRNKFLWPQLGTSLKFQTADKSFVLGVGGRIQVDAIFHDQNRANVARVGRLEDEVEFRRARLKAYGTIHKIFAYKAEYDFASGSRPGFNDVFIQLKKKFDLGPLQIQRITVGHQKEAFSIEEAESTNHFTFTERAISAAFVPASRNTGLRVDTKLGKKVFWHTGIYKDTNGFGDGEGNGDAAVSTRAGWVETFGEQTPEFECVLHVGGSLTYRKPGRESLTYGARPEIVGSAPTFLSTGTLVTDRAKAYGFEVAFLRGPLLIQAEYIRAAVDLSRGGRNPNFDGFYALVSYVFNAQGRAYKHSGGYVGRMKMTDEQRFDGAGQWGAWEIAGRISGLDLNDSGIRGGKAIATTLGLNWYLTTFLRMQTNWIHHDLEGGEAADFLTFRWAIDF